MAQDGIQVLPRNAIKRRPSDPGSDDDGWRKAWQIKFKYGKSNNLSVWLIDRLTRSDGGRWISMEEGRFELEWIDTANAWYAERQRRSKSSQSTHLLYKAIQAAFPNIAEESSEKNKHIFVRRSFKLPDELCDEVRQIVIGTGTKRPQTKTIQIPGASGGIHNPHMPPFPLVDSASVLLPKAQYKVPDTLMKDFMSAVSSTSIMNPENPAGPPITQCELLYRPDSWQAGCHDITSSWNMDIPTERISHIPEITPGSSPKHDPHEPGHSDHKIRSPPMSPGFLKDVTYQANCHEATFEQICEYAKQQLEIIHKWASEMPSFKHLSCNDQKALLTSSAPEILVFSICCFSVQNKCGPDNLLLDKDLVISRTNRQFEVAIRNIVSFIIDTIVDPLKDVKTDRYELSRLRRIILFNTTTKSTHQNLKDPEEVRKLRRTEHVLLQKYTDNTQGRIGELLLLLPPLTTAGTLFVEHLHLEKLVGDTFDNLVAAELLLAMGNG